jgi:hypothetical protein
VPVSLGRPDPSASPARAAASSAPKRIPSPFACPPPAPSPPPQSPTAAGSGHGGLLLPNAEARSAYRMLFLRALLVAPNKFRPPSRVGDELYEHAQNVSLTKILNAAIELNTTALASSVAQRTPGGSGADPAQVRAHPRAAAALLFLRRAAHARLRAHADACGCLVEAAALSQSASCAAASLVLAAPCTTRRRRRWTSLGGSTRG